MSSNIIFETKDLAKSYGKTIAIDGISIRIKKGETYGILGPNGSGKTTTLSIATGIVDQDQGEFSLFNSISTPDSRKKIGSMIEVPNFYPYLSLFQNLKLVALIKETGLDDIERVLKLVKLYDRRNSKFKTLSLGMKQRLGIAAAMLGDPEVMVLDEPANGLDPEGIAEVRELILREAARGKTIIMASHILSEVEKVCSHVAILKNGKLLAEGDVKTIIKGEQLIELDGEDREKIKNALNECNFIESFTPEVDGFFVSLKNNKNATHLNEFLFSKGIILSRLITHNKSLESQFLELVKDVN